ncbi:MAG: hypothetical protein COX29_03480 [Candidatus Moranbacteria bacterium CG23_combo_of_CG06-09_8_20_14_all_35_22]|nr:MAG: hypothetical protein COX29_03480 [Candidatus Moranbacteria bacterium CG23_combo_of_CG06-09_8_20_14_all_35_22]
MSFARLASTSGLRESRRTNSHRYYYSTTDFEIWEMKVINNKKTDGDKGASVFLISLFLF